MSAYIGQRKREHDRSYRPDPPTAYALDDARHRLRGMLPELAAWTALAGVAPMALEGDGPSRASYLASTLSASLELVREGEMEARQLEAFADLYLRKRKAKPEAAA
jgi:segregation and condensation protein A